MPDSVTALGPLKSSVELIVSHARGNTMEAELRPVFLDVLRYFEAHDSELGDLPDDDPVIVDVIIAEVANPLIERYEHWFDTFACLLRGYEYAGYYRSMSQRCIIDAFGMLRDSAADRSLLEDSVVMKWMETITTS